jgi:hypothetical protein
MCPCDVRRGSRGKIYSVFCLPVVLEERIPIVFIIIITKSSYISAFILCRRYNTQFFDLSTSHKDILHSTHPPSKRLHSPNTQLGFSHTRNNPSFSNSSSNTYLPTHQASKKKKERHTSHQHGLRHLQTTLPIPPSHAPNKTQ